MPFQFFLKTFKILKRAAGDLHAQENILKFFARTGLVIYNDDVLILDEKHDIELKKKT
jgi:hypothetical protein